MIGGLNWLVNSFNAMSNSDNKALFMFHSSTEITEIQDKAHRGKMLNSAMYLTENILYSKATAHLI